VELLQQYLGRPNKRAGFADWLLVIGLVIVLIALLAFIVLVSVWLARQLWSVLQAPA
jgi:hypothetical protein